MRADQPVQKSDSPSSELPQAAGKYLIWDLPLRLFHWLLLICLAGSWITAEAGFDWTETHFLFGYCSLGLILFRIIWGFVGPTHARFSATILNPKNFQAIINEARSLSSNKPSTHVGHGLVGYCSAILMLILVATQATSGLFISDDILYAGPYNGVVSSATAGQLAQIHHINFTVLQVVVAIHVVAVFWYLLRKKQNLINPMISGQKRLADQYAKYAIPSSKIGLAILLALLAGLSIWLLVWLAPPPPLPDYF